MRGRAALTRVYNTSRGSTLDITHPEAADQQLASIANIRGTGKKSCVALAEAFDDI
jgi:hypothetical protein